MNQKREFSAVWALAERLGLKGEEVKAERIEQTELDWLNKLQESYLIARSAADRFNMSIIDYIVYLRARYELGDADMINNDGTIGRGALESKKDE